MKVTKLATSILCVNKEAHILLSMYLLIFYCMLFVYKHYSEKGSIGLTKLPKEAMAQNKTLHIEDCKDISRRSLDTEQMHRAEPPPTTTNPLWSMT